MARVVRGCQCHASRSPAHHQHSKNKHRDDQLAQPQGNPAPETGRWAHAHGRTRPENRAAEPMRRAERDSESTERFLRLTEHGAAPGDSMASTSFLLPHTRLRGSAPRVPSLTTKPQPVVPAGHSRWRLLRAAHGRVVGLGARVISRRLWPLARHVGWRRTARTRVGTTCRRGRRRNRSLGTQQRRARAQREADSRAQHQRAGTQPTVRVAGAAVALGLRLAMGLRSAPP